MLYTARTQNSTKTGTEIMDFQLKIVDPIISQWQHLFLRLQSSFFLNKILTSYYFEFNDIFYLMIQINCSFVNICRNK